MAAAVVLHQAVAMCLGLKHLELAGVGGCPPGDLVGHLGGQRSEPRSPSESLEDLLVGQRDVLFALIVGPDALQLFNFR